jgi:phosphatidylethanolamine/phosphatidyl-N-methylethanolamine N-methyltransferase
MAHDLHLAPAVTGPPNALGAAHHRDTHRHRGRLAPRRPRHQSADPSDPRGPAPDTGLIAAHWTSPVVVEIEPGDTAVTEVLRTRLTTGSTLIGVASDDTRAGHLRRTRPWLTVLQGDATDLRRVLHAAGIAGVHLVIDTLSPAVMAEATQRRLICSVADVLHPDGCVAVVVAPPVRSPLTVRRLHRRLGEVFTVVTRTAAMWDRAAPAYLLVARKPIRPPVGMRRGEHVASPRTDLSAAA